MKRSLAIQPNIVDLENKIIHQDELAIKSLLDQERESLDTFFDKIDITAFARLLDVIKNCKGMIILSGVGKSGAIAKKISVSLISIGCRAFHLSPLNALHGDLGMVSEGDVVLLLSRSGESEELLQTIPFLHAKGAIVASIVFNCNSRLQKASDLCLCVPSIKELCPYDMLPTTSSTIQMIIGDIITIFLMNYKQLSKEQFAMNHPAGRIGRRLTLRVKDIMVTGEELPFCQKTHLIKDILVELTEKRCRCALVIGNEERLIGIFTLSDLSKALTQMGADALETQVERWLSNTHHTVNENDLVWKAFSYLTNIQDSRHIVWPVVNDFEKVVGLMRVEELMRSGVF